MPRTEQQKIEELVQHSRRSAHIERASLMASGVRQRATTFRSKKEYRRKEKYDTSQRDW